MDWFDVEGVVVGYLQQDEDGEGELDVMVVKADKLSQPHTATFTTSLPPFVLRWVGNDYRVLEGDDDGYLIGCRIAFTTNAEEQARYASKEG